MYLEEKAKGEAINAHNALLSVEDLVAWLETKELEGKYDFMSNSECLLCQYLTARLGMSVSIGGTYWRFAGGKECTDLTKEMRDIAVTAPWTFGAALTRARAYLG